MQKKRAPEILSLAIMKTNLMWVSVYNRLLFELELAGVSATALDPHGSIVIAINFS